METNGSNTANSTFALLGSIAPYDVFVLENSAESLGVAADQQLTPLNFNGDDTVVLRNGSTIIDAIGQIGFDPGSEWTGSTCTQGTSNGTLVRNSTILTGDSNGNNSFNPDSEWTCYDVDDISNLGSHTSDCQSPTPELQLVDNTATNQNCGYTIDFGTQANTTNTDLTFDIENVGSADLIITSLEIIGDYTIVSPAGGFTITSGNNQTVTVRFTPTTDGTRNGTLTINNNDANEGICTVDLIGIGFTPAPEIRVERSLLKYLLAQERVQDLIQFLQQQLLAIQQLQKHITLEMKELLT